MSTWKLILIALLLLSVVVLVFSSASPRSPLMERGLARWSQRHPSWVLGGAEDRSWTENLGLQLGSVLSQFLTGVVMIYLAPARTKRIADVLTRGPAALLRYLGIGLMLAVAMVAIGLLSALAVYTFPLPFILVAVFFLAALGGTIALTLTVGKALLGRAGWPAAHPWTQLAMGTLLLFSLSRLPYVGLGLLAIAAVLGAGAAVATHFGSGRPWTLAPLIEGRET